MHDESKTDRRNFIATAVSVASSALAVGLCQTEAQGQEAAAEPIPQQQFLL